MPHYNVVVIHIVVSGHPVSDPVGAVALVRVITRREQLSIFVLRDPDGSIGEMSSTMMPRVSEGKKSLEAISIMETEVV